MSKRKKKTTLTVHGASKGQHSGETKAADATTVGWTVSVTTVRLCDVGAAAACFYTQSYPTARGMLVLGELLLFAAAIIGLFSLAMLPAVFKLRRVRPPSGFTVFAICVAVAPILAIVIRNLR